MGLGGSSVLLIVITSLIGALVAGFAALAGTYLQKTDLSGSTTGNHLNGQSCHSIPYLSAMRTLVLFFSFSFFVMVPLP